MKIEIVNTLKCSTVWKKGTVFDDAVSPIPGDIIKEAKNGSKAVRVIAAEKPIAVVEPEIEIKETVEETSTLWEKLPPAEDPPQEKTSKPAFPELEGLIEKNTSVKAVAHLLNVSYQTVLRWRSGKSKPKDNMLRKIKREFKKVKADDQSRTDHPDSI